MAIPRRPVILYVDLRAIPDIMATLNLPEAYTLTRDNIPTLTELTFAMNDWGFQCTQSWKKFMITSIAPGIPLSQIILFDCPLSIRWAPTRTYGIKQRYEMFSIATDLGGIMNKILKMDPGHGSATHMLRSSFAFELFNPFALVDHRESFVCVP